MDSGLACHLLGIEHNSALQKSLFSGPLFEGFVASEIAKQQVNRGGRAEICYFRDQQGLEVDFVVPLKSQKLALIEAKSTRTPTPSMAISLRRLSQAITGHATTSMLVHSGNEGAIAGGVLAPGVTALTLSELLETLA